MDSEHLAIDNQLIAKSITNSPVYSLNEKEFDNNLALFGSFSCIAKNKKINQTMLLVLLLEDETYRNSFQLLSGVDNIKLLLYKFIIRFPNLCKSKIIKNKIKKFSRGYRKQKRAKNL